MPYQVVSYDKENNVIFMDFSNLLITADIMTETEAGVIEIAERLSDKVYLLACFQNTKIASELQSTWGSYAQRALERGFKGVIRYAVSDMVTNVTLRSNTIRYHLQGSNSHIYPTREAALQALRDIEKENIKKRN